MPLATHYQDSMSNHSEDVDLEYDDDLVDFKEVLWTIRMSLN